MDELKQKAVQVSSVMKDEKHLWEKAFSAIGSNAKEQIVDNLHPVLLKGGPAFAPPAFSLVEYQIQTTGLLTLSCRAASSRRKTERARAELFLQTLILVLIADRDPIVELVVHLTLSDEVKAPSAECDPAAVAEFAEFQVERYEDPALL